MSLSLATVSSPLLWTDFWPAASATYPNVSNYWDRSGLLDFHFKSTSRWKNDNVATLQSGGGEGAKSLSTILTNLINRRNLFSRIRTHSSFISNNKTLRTSLIRLLVIKHTVWLYTTEGRLVAMATRELHRENKWPKFSYSLVTYKQYVRCCCLLLFNLVLNKTVLRRTLINSAQILHELFHPQNRREISTAQTNVIPKTNFVCSRDLYLIDFFKI